MIGFWHLSAEKRNEYFEKANFLLDNSYVEGEKYPLAENLYKIDEQRRLKEEPENKERKW